MRHNHLSEDYKTQTASQLTIFSRFYHLSEGKNICENLALQRKSQEYMLCTLTWRLCFSYTKNTEWSPHPYIACFGALRNGDFVARV